MELVTLSKVALTVRGELEEATADGKQLLRLPKPMRSAAPAVAPRLCCASVCARQIQRFDRLTWFGELDQRRLQLTH